MSVTMEDSIKRWTAKRKTALVVEIIHGKTTEADASQAHLFDIHRTTVELYRQGVIGTPLTMYLDQDDVSRHRGKACISSQA
jgi:hypothetical protein